MSKQRTTQEFIEIARQVHEDKYDYTKSIYTKKDEKLIVTCLSHGDFLQGANHHIRGRGCPKCSFDSHAKITINAAKQSFEEKARKVHDNHYDYSQVEYTHSMSKVKIFCRKHGYFEQTPRDHLLGNSCRQCSYESQALTLEKFTEEANKTHNNTYSYEKFIYKNSHTKGIIICPVHGEFTQTASNHMRWNGCPKCSSLKISKYQQNNPLCWGLSGWRNRAHSSKNFDGFKVYILKLSNNNEQFYKIGRTYRETIKRIKGIPYQAVVVYEIRDENPQIIYELENKLKQQYKNYKYTPKETFSGRYECFSVDLPVHRIIEQYPQVAEVESDVPNPELYLQVGECIESQ